MKSATKRKPARIDLVLERRLKKSYETAAAYRGLGLSSFIRLACSEKIERMRQEGYSPAGRE